MNDICFEGQIAPVKNGFVVKFGCKTFVVKPNQLDAVLAYYNDKTVKPPFREHVTKGEEFVDWSAAIPCRDCTESDIPLYGKPSFLTDSSTSSIYKVTNGWVVNDGKDYYMATTEKEVVEILFPKKK